MGFKRERKSNSGGETQTERSSDRSSDRRESRRDRGSDREEQSERRSNRTQSRGDTKYAFTNIGSVKQGRNLTDKDAAQLKGCGESIKIKLYMPNVAQIVLVKDAVIGINLGRRASDKDFVLAQAVLPLGSVTPTEKTAEDLVDFLTDFGEFPEFDLIAQVFLPKDIETITLKHGQTMLVTFKTGEKSEKLDFVLGTISIAND